MTKNDNDKVARVLKAAAEKRNAAGGSRSQGIVPINPEPATGWERASDPTVKIAAQLLAGFAANPANNLHDAFMRDEGFGDRAIEHYVCKSLNIAQELLTQNAERERGVE